LVHQQKGRQQPLQDTEKTAGKAIDLIRATRPILIVDEPQSVDGGLEGAARKHSGR